MSNPHPGSSEAAPVSQNAARRVLLAVDPRLPEAESFESALGSAFQGGSAEITPVAYADADALAEAVQALAGNRDAHLVVCYPNPVLTVAAQLGEGEGESSAAAAWAAGAEQLLRLFRSNRRRVTLVDGHAAMFNPERLSQALQGRLGDCLDLPKTAAFDPDWLGRPLARLVAAHDIAVSDGAAIVLAELEASSLPLEFPVQAATTELLADWQPAEAEAAAENAGGEDAEELKEENELLMLQLHQVQEELESYFLANRDLQRQLQNASSDTSALDGSRQELEQARKELDQVKKELDMTRTAVSDMQSSLSWKLTAPLRSVLGVFRGRGDG